MKGIEMGYKCDDCKYGIANGGFDIDCPPCNNFDGFAPVDKETEMREFIKNEANNFEMAGLSEDAARYREFIADLYPCA